MEKRLSSIRGGKLTTHKLKWTELNISQYWRIFQSPNDKAINCSQFFFLFCFYSKSLWMESKVKPNANLNYTKLFSYRNKVDRQDIINHLPCSIYSFLFVVFFCKLGVVSELTSWSSVNSLKLEYLIFWRYKMFLTYHNILPIYHNMGCN